ncbi:MAG TPA: nitroreductase [Xanthomonadaceae bacterium]|nr:nitroreductase [Xanthomonadaceae bacterium]
MTAYDFLASRRSVPARLLGEPGPSDAQILDLLRLAVRVPDHGKLEPWRYLLIRGDARYRLGEIFRARHAEIDPAVQGATLEKDRLRFTFAPAVIAVVARVMADHRIPAQEQVLSAGLSAFTLLLGAQALGFDAQWLTGWAAYDHGIAQVLGLAPDERIVAFVHIGTAQGDVPERPRPDPATLLTEWTG